MEFCQSKKVGTLKQECIPVGCVPPAVVAVPGGLQAGGVSRHQAPPREQTPPTDIPPPLTE